MTVQNKYNNIPLFLGWLESEFQNVLALIGLWLTEFLIPSSRSNKFVLSILWLSSLWFKSWSKLLLKFRLVFNKESSAGNDSTSSSKFSKSKMLFPRSGNILYRLLRSLLWLAELFCWFRVLRCSSVIQLSSICLVDIKVLTTSLSVSSKFWIN